MSCLFCRIIRGEVPCYKVFENEHALAFLDVGPLSVGHTLVIPKSHAATMDEVPDECLADMMVAIKKVAKAIRAEFGEGMNYNVLQNNGRMAHQFVPHVHYHVIPKPNAEQGLGVHWPIRETPKPAALTTLAASLASHCQ
ncbi:putative HIT family protein 1 [Paratrimastix pyriformis]|uniref:HIT family protein 1 n=1 Tax=Paratrimastix pyriformis TaxID=342808 RepID=A0ABQ8UCT7_9EUKA|nr:putative HIT family protein 1 [Paratrimastix pyriformis]